MATLSLVDIAKLNGGDALAGLIEENANVAPELSVIPARTIRGTSYKLRIRDGDPTASFRHANESITASKSTFNNKTIECMILGGLMTVDKAVALANEDGPDALKAIEASGLVRSAMQAIGRQIFYGVNTTYSGDAKGFPGLLALVASAMKLDATGSTSTTGSSAYLVKFGPQYVQLLSGNGGQFTLSEWREELVSSVPSYVCDMTSWVGMQFGHSKSCARIYNLTADSGKGLTDTLIANALSKFPVGVIPDAIFCSRRSAMQLQTSRSVTINASERGAGVGNISPFPTSAFGIPVVVTDSISDVEAIGL